MKTLVMGGTRFNGLHLVQELVRCGHTVTTLNRGVTEARLPREVRRLYADRKDVSQLKETLGSEEFDVVFDISAYVLEDVESMVDIFEGRTGHYVFASSTVVYAASNILPINEDFSVDSTPRQSDYGRNKLICEEFLMRAFRQRRFPYHGCPLLHGLWAGQRNPGQGAEDVRTPAEGAQDTGAGPGRHARPGRPRGRRGQGAAHDGP